MKPRTQTIIGFAITVSVGVAILSLFDLRMITAADIPLWAHVVISAVSLFLTILIVAWAVGGGLPRPPK